MVTDLQSTKLLALHKAAMGQERMTLQEKLKVEKVVEERLCILEDLQEKKKSIQLEVNELVEKKKVRALQKSDVDQVNSISSYVDRLRKELDEITISLDTRVEDYERAKLRLDDCIQELQEAKIERKKIEKLIESNDAAKLIKREALSESRLEERGIFKGKK